MLTIATNTLRSTKNIIYTDKLTKYTNNSCHAEIGCLKYIISDSKRRNVNVNNIKLISLAFKITIDDDQDITEISMSMAKPCRMCTYALLHHGIENIYYSNSNNKIEYMSMNNQNFKVIINSSQLASGDVMKLNVNDYFSRYTYSHEIKKGRVTGIIVKKDNLINILSGFGYMCEMLLTYNHNGSTKYTKLNIRDITFSNSINKLIESNIDHIFPNESRKQKNNIKRKIKNYKSGIVRSSNKTYAYINFSLA